MMLTDIEASQVKAIYAEYHEGLVEADEALYQLELLINGEEE